MDIFSFFCGLLIGLVLAGIILISYFAMVKRKLKRKLEHLSETYDFSEGVRGKYVGRNYEPGHVNIDDFSEGEQGRYFSGRKF